MLKVLILQWVLKEIIFFPLQVNLPIIEIIKLNHSVFSSSAILSQILSLNNFTSTYKAWYFNTSTSKRYEFDAEASFVSIPLTLSYNFNAVDNGWEFFVDAGYNLLIEQNTVIKSFSKDTVLFPYDRVNTSKFYNYFTVGFSGRYKLYNSLSISLGTRSYHYLPLNNNFGNGFPTLSAYSGLAYIF